MANVVSLKNGLSPGINHGAKSAHDMLSSAADENQTLGRTTPVTPNARATTSLRSPPPQPTSRKNSAHSSETYPSKRVNGNAASQSDEEIPENMYRPEKDDPEGWIHRDKLAKIESEELQAAGINLANARSRSQSKTKSERQTRDTDSRRDEKRQRLQSPVEMDDELDHQDWDLRLPEEIDADNSASASQIYTNPVLRKSGSKIPVLTSSPAPIPAERYERDTPIARKRTASGTLSFEGDLSVPKTRNNTSTKTTDDSDATSSAIASSKPSSPQKQRSKSATVSPASPTPKVPTSAARKASAPPRGPTSPTQRPGTRSGEQDRPRTAVNRPEGDPPWLATMYKPDPRLPPDQQLIPTLAKKQMQAQWAEAGAVPKTYDREFTPIAVHTEQDLAKENTRHTRTPSPIKTNYREEKIVDTNAMSLKQAGSIGSNSGRPDTSGSVTGGYSTMPKVLSPPPREDSPKTGAGPAPASGSRPTNMAPPTRMQAQSLDIEEDEKVKKGCGCCIIM